MKLIDLPVEWTKAKEDIFKKLGKVFIAGKIDSGKTTFALYLVRQAIQQGLKVALIDSDIGQSTIGPPTTIGLKFFNTFSDLNSLNADFLYFVGDISPRSCPLEMLTGVKKLVEKADEGSPELIVIDSCGFIAPPLGLNLKVQKISLIEPEFIILFTRNEPAQNGEIELVEKAIKAYNYRLIKLFPSPRVKLTSLEERKKNRERTFEIYFKKAKEAFLYWKNLSVYPDYLVNNSFENLFGTDLKNLIVGLFDYHQNCLGIGIILEVDFDKQRLKIFSPIKRIDKIKGLKFGFLKVSPEGKEISRLNFP